MKTEKEEKHLGATAGSDHTPTPWTLELEDTTYSNCFEVQAEGKTIAHVESWNGEDNDAQEEAEANAAFIVRAVNAHDNLVEALKNLRGNIDVSTINTSAKATAKWGELIVRAEAALKLAEGGK